MSVISEKRFKPSNPVFMGVTSDEDMKRGVGSKNLLKEVSKRALL